MNKKTILILLACSVLPSLVSYSQTKTNVHLNHIFKINGSGKWDYLVADHEQNRIYVSHGSQVNVLNEITGDSVATITNTLGVHGIALVTVLGKGYTSNGKTGDCTVFDIKSNKELSRIKAGENPDALFYDQYCKKLFVFNGRSLDATVIDPITDQVIATIPLGGKPETGVSDGKGKIFVNIEDKNEVVCFDSGNYKILNRFALKGGEEPSGLALDRKTSRLFIGCANKKMLVMDAKNGVIISSLPIGNGCDGIAFDPVLKQIYSSNGEGTMTVIKASPKGQYRVIQTVKTVPGARTLSVDLQSHHIFLPVGDKSILSETFKILEYGL